MIVYLQLFDKLSLECDNKRLVDTSPYRFFIEFTVPVLQPFTQLLRMLFKIGEYLQTISVCNVDLYIEAVGKTDLLA